MTRGILKYHEKERERDTFLVDRLNFSLSGQGNAHWEGYMTSKN